MNSSLWQLIVIQFKNFIREPAILFWAIGFPILMAWVLGIAFTERGEQRKTVYVIAEEGAVDKQGALEYENAGTKTHYTFKESTEEEAIRSLKRGETSLYYKKQGDSTLYYFDPANPEAQLIYHQLEDARVKEASLPKVRVVRLTNTGSRYIDFLVPGLIAMGIMNTCLWGIGWAMIEYRQKKLLRRMVATPMRKSYFLLAQLLSRALISIIEGILLLIFVYFYFDLEIEGSFISLLIIYLAGIAAFSGIAILISSRVRKSEIGNGLINVVVLPMTILSGVFFSYHNFPEWAIPVIKVLPLTLLADNIRSIFLEGPPITDVLISAGILFAIGLICFAAGLKLYKWY